MNIAASQKMILLACFSSKLTTEQNTSIYFAPGLIPTIACVELRIRHGDEAIV